MARAFTCVEQQEEKKTGGRVETRKDSACASMAELSLRCSQVHPLTRDIHGARLSRSLGRSPSAPADKAWLLHVKRTDTKALYCVNVA